jgi:hypothetical protein
MTAQYQVASPSSVRSAPRVRGGAVACVARMKQPRGIKDRSTKRKCEVMKSVESRVTRVDERKVKS